MNRILLDHGLAPRAAASLRQHGLDVVHLSELNRPNRTGVVNLPTTPFCDRERLRLMCSVA